MFHYQRNLPKEGFGRYQTNFTDHVPHLDVQTPLEMQYDLEKREIRLSL